MKQETTKLSMPRQFWLAASLIMLAWISPTTGQESTAQEPGADANAAFNALFSSAEKRLQSAGPRLDAVRAEVIEELVAFDTEYAGSVAAAVALLNAGNLAEVLGEYDRAEGLYRNALREGLTQELHGDISNAIAGVIARPGRVVPDFTATTMAGDEVSPESLKGKVVLLDFWATWCGPCVAELPHLQSAYETWHPKGFEIISISVDQQRDDVTKFQKRNAMPWKHVFDEDRPAEQRLAERFAVYGIPHTILVGKDGKIVATELRGNALSIAVEKALGQ